MKTDDRADAPGQAQQNKRIWIYPRLIKGTLYSYRNALSYALLLVLFTGPFIKINGEQLVLLNVIERKFVFFGVIFMPQDFYLFALALLTFMVFIVLFTVVFGRVWCGWACPQTIFMEMVFRKIEFWIEGDGIKQRKLDNSPLTAEKFFKKGFKHLIYITISFFIANIFLAYIIGTESLLQIVNDPVNKHIGGFLAICVFTIIFYLVFAKLRELVCTVICPYGRLQEVLLDRKTLIVAYDYLRGEPRGHISKIQTTVPKGDCIDCGICVDVCPTGIDIRKGTQMECINCTACIDACDMVMEKTHRPLRLIGFKSEQEIQEGKPFRFGTRVYAYLSIFLLLFSLLSFLLIQRSDISTRILRAGGTLFQLRDDQQVSNLYNAELVNKTSAPIKFQLKPQDSSTKIQFISPVTELPKGGTANITFFLIRSQGMVKSYKSTLVLEIVSPEGKVLNEVETTFIAPPKL